MREERLDNPDVLVWKAVVLKTPPYELPPGNVKFNTIMYNTTDGKNLFDT
jgi:hypothetical protein